MLQPTPLYIVASPQPRVGKTLIARLLLEFLQSGNRQPIGYDLHPRQPMLAACFPAVVTAADIAETPGQMALFDVLLTQDSRARVIDLGYGLFEQFFAVMAEIGFEEEAARRMLCPVVLFVADSLQSTAQTYAALQGSLPQTLFVPVHNEGASFIFSRWDFPPTHDTCGVIRIPRLSPAVSGVIDRPKFSFQDYMAKESSGPAEVHDWISTIFAEFRDFELRLLMRTLNASLNGGASRPA